MSGKAYMQGTPEAEKLNVLALPILEYLKDIPLEVRITLLINLGVGAALDAGWFAETLKRYCAETTDVQVAQLKLNKAGAN